MALQYIVYSDESEEKGTYYSNFYGGLVVRSDDFEQLVQILNDVKVEERLNGEVKWQKVTHQYVDKYIRFIDVFMDLVAANRAKIRIMFRQNRWRPQGLTPEQRDNEYFLLYYQFLKNAFGWEFSNLTGEPISLRFYPDQLAEQTEAKKDRFKDFLVNLQNLPEMRKAKLTIRREDIAEVTSHDHVLLQALDVVMGAMNFKLNGLDRVIPEGQNRRGKRTLAKEKLYKHILDRIRETYPGFNIGINTGISDDVRNRWLHPYRHWLFVPSSAVLDPTAPTKHKKTRTPSPLHPDPK